MTTSTIPTPMLTSVQNKPLLLFFERAIVMKYFCLFFSLLIVSSPVSVTAADPPPKMRLLVPAYFYPAGKGEKEWERLLAAPEEAGVVAIVNPASGPGRR